MLSTVKQFIKQEIRTPISFRKSERSWHIPVLTAVCIGIPLLAGLYFKRLDWGLAACLACTVILYYEPNVSAAKRMITMLACSFGFILSLSFGLIFSFNPIVASVMFGFFAFSVHWLILYLKVKPPGSFFFIFIASQAFCKPFDLSILPEKIGLMAMGTMLTSFIALIYTLFTLRKGLPETENDVQVGLRKPNFNFFESIIIGLFMLISMLLGHVLKLENPYWVPISCLAVMQGATLYHIWQRGLQRVAGTLIGLGLCWLMLSVSKTPLSICLSIILMQFLIELFIVKHYGIAVIFITPLTIFLIDGSSAASINTNDLIYIRFWDILLGSFIGAIGGWFMHHEKLRHFTLIRMRQTKSFFFSKSRK